MGAPARLPWPSLRLMPQAGQRLATPVPKLLQVENGATAGTVGGSGSRTPRSSRSSKPQAHRQASRSAQRESQAREHHAQLQPSAAPSQQRQLRTAVALGRVSSGDRCGRMQLERHRAAERGDRALCPGHRSSGGAPVDPHAHDLGDRLWQRLAQGPDQLERDQLRALGETGSLLSPSSRRSWTSKWSLRSTSVSFGTAECPHPSELAADCSRQPPFGTAGCARSAPRMLATAASRVARRTLSLRAASARVSSPDSRATTSGWPLLVLGQRRSSWAAASGACPVLALGPGRSIPARTRRPGLATELGPGDGSTSLFGRFAWHERFADSRLQRDDR